jgi:hypothetical protein
MWLYYEQDRFNTGFKTLRINDVENLLSISFEKFRIVRLCTHLLSAVTFLIFDLLTLLISFFVLHQTYFHPACRRLIFSCECNENKVTSFILFMKSRGFFMRNNIFLIKYRQICFRKIIFFRETVFFDRVNDYLFIECFCCLQMIILNKIRIAGIRLCLGYKPKKFSSQTKELAIYSSVFYDSDKVHIKETVACLLLPFYEINIIATSCKLFIPRWHPVLLSLFVRY